MCGTVIANTVLRKSNRTCAIRTAEDHAHRLPRDVEPLPMHSLLHLLSHLRLPDYFHPFIRSGELVYRKVAWSSPKVPAFSKA